jgi:hypothetical protein
MIASNSVRTHWSSPVTIVQKASSMSGLAVPVEVIVSPRCMAHHHPFTVIPDPQIRDPQIPHDFRVLGITS